GLLRLREAVDVPAVAARAIARGPSSWFRTLTIGVGRRDGIQPGSAVLAPGGLLGQVYQVSYASSQVLCLVDRLGSVGARLQPERARQVIGVCKGDGTSLCTLVYSNANADVRPGDAVVTSGQEQGSLFPPGLLIGHVVSIERRPDQSSLVCHIRPAVDPDLAEEVLVLTPGTPEGRS
ncbi:MAG: rod shape-determining protein MreC, partial [Armatimonadetes bacterium]|nr:rod shape-determining protein MreC [Armatimonadota bacterium]